MLERSNTAGFCDSVKAAHSRWQTSGERGLISSICTVAVLYAQKPVQMQRVVTKWDHIMGLFPLGEAQELGENLIFYFLSVFNTIQLLLLRQKLRAMQPDNTKVSWIIDYLADRPQFVLSRSSVLDLLLQRSTVLSAFLIRTLSLTRLNCGHATPTFSLMIPSLWAAWGGALHMSLVGRWAGWSKGTICSWLFLKWRRLLEPSLDKWDIFVIMEYK